LPKRFLDGGGEVSCVIWTRTRKETLRVETREEESSSHRFSRSDKRFRFITIQNRKRQQKNVTFKKMNWVSENRFFLFVKKIIKIMKIFKFKNKYFFTYFEIKFYFSDYKCLYLGKSWKETVNTIVWIKWKTLNNNENTHEKYKELKNKVFWKIYSRQC
jgi:hypothetical protein